MAEVTKRQGREGNRWVNERPTADAVAEWFKEAVFLPEGLEHSHYVSGVTLIEGTEKSKEMHGFGDDGRPQFSDVYNLVFTPYVKVETRVQFWQDLCELRSGEWEAFLEPVEQPEWSSKLPPGFSKAVVAVNEGRSTAFICSTMKVTVYKRGTVKYVEVVNRRTGEVSTERRGEILIGAPPATKMIPLISNGADPMSLMKAETGAVGRALGFAGMLIVPGTGVATAEDMREAQAFETQLASAREGGEDAPPAAEGKARLDAAVEPTHDELVALAGGAITKLKELHEPEHTAFMAWVKERGFGGKLSDRKDEELKQVLKKAEAELEAGETRAKAQAEA